MQFSHRIAALGLALIMTGGGLAAAQTATEQAGTDGSGTSQTEAAQTEAAQGEAEVYGDWLLQCAANGAERCVLTQRIVSSETREVVAVIGFGALVGGPEGYALTFNVPEGADLSASPVYRIDGAEAQVAMAWRVCFDGACRAAASATVESANAMQEAGAAIFGYRKYRETELTVTRVSFDGLAEGLAAMAAK